MATVREYLQIKLKGHKIILTDEELNLYGIENGVDMDATFIQGLSKDMAMILLAIIPEILAKPDVTESDWSEKWDRDAILKYCSWLSLKYGLTDPFVQEEPTISDASHFW